MDELSNDEQDAISRNVDEILADLREADRAKYPGLDFNGWLDEVDSDGVSNWHYFADIEAAWAHWQGME